MAFFPFSCPDICKCSRVYFAALLHEELLEKLITHILLCNLNELLTFECFSRHSFYFSFHLGFILTLVFLLSLCLHLPLFTQPLSLLFLFVPFDSFQLLLFRKTLFFFHRFQLSLFRQTVSFFLYCTNDSVVSSYFLHAVVN